MGDGLGKGWGESRILDGCVGRIHVMKLAVGGAVNLLEMLIKGLETQEICVRGGRCCWFWDDHTEKGLYLFLVRGRCLLRAFNLSEISRFSRKRMLGLDESLVVI